MTRAGASRLGNRWTGRLWRTLHGLSSRLSLRTKLIASLITLVIIALVVISCVSASILRGYLLGQTDADLRGQALEQIAAQAVQDQLNGSSCMRAGFELANSGNAVWWIPAGGTIQQVVQPSADGMSTTCLGSGGPALSTVSAAASRLAASPGLT